MNLVRVLVGGLAAGLVVNIVELLVQSLWLGPAWSEALAAIGASVLPGPAGAGLLVLWGFLVGTTAVWIYAAAVPRFGAGPKTAVRAGLATWVLGYLSGSIAALPIGIFPAWLLGMSTLVGLPEAIGATLVGAAVYREQHAA
jgi:hypothetical protein